MAKGNVRVRYFELPVVHADASVHAAIEEAIDANVSGVLVRGGRGRIHLVGFDSLIDAANSRRSLARVPGSSVMRLSLSEDTRIQQDYANLDPEYARTLDDAGRLFGLLRIVGSSAHLISRHEGLATYASPSGGVHCQRPQRPPGTPNRSWFHYYPPNVRDPVTPGVCVFCKSPLP